MPELSRLTMVSMLFTLGLMLMMCAEFFPTRYTAGASNNQTSDMHPLTLSLSLFCFLDIHRSWNRTQFLWHDMFGKVLIGFFATLPKRPLLGTRQWLRPVSKLTKVELDCTMISLTLASLDKLNIKLCICMYIYIYYKPLCKGKLFDNVW